MKRMIAALAAGLLFVGNAQASQSLSCQLEQEGAKGTAFNWSYAHGGAEGPDIVKTSIGEIGHVEGPGYSTAITLNGKPIALPPEHHGVIRFGKVFERGKQVALAYMVMRERDSQASSSELVFLVNKNGSVSQIAVQPGDSEQVAGHCYLVQ